MTAQAALTEPVKTGHFKPVTPISDFHLQSLFDLA
jgi:hypothetical protein